MVASATVVVMGTNRVPKLTIRSPRRATTTAAKVGTSLFFLVFAVMGGIFLVLIVRDFGERLATYRWQPTPCVMVSSLAQVRSTSERESGYEVSLKYRYTVAGREHSSTQFQKKYKGESTYEAADQIARRFPVESTQTCYVDPADPASAVLERGSLWMGLFLFLPLVFVFIGVGGICTTWRSRPADPTPASGPSGQMGRRGTILFFGIFAMVGGAFVYGLLVRPLAQIQTARGWTPTPCTILNSRVTPHEGKKSTTYSVDILYSYVFNDRLYKSSRYSFSVGSTSGYDGKATIVQAYPAGANATCYVDPHDPTSAVLDRAAPMEPWFGAIPGVFLLIGAWGLYWTIVLKPRRDRAREAGDFSMMVNAERRRAGIDVGASREPAGLIELKSTMGPVGKLVFGVVFSVFWNGVISVFAFQVVKSLRTGSPDWCLTIFLVPFVVVGIGMIGFTLHSLLALRNPRVKIRLSNGPVFTGETVTVEWELTGPYDSVERLVISFKGQVSKRQGKTSTTTDLYSEVVVDETRRMNLPKGKATFVIPENARGSDDKGNDNNETVSWKLATRAYIPNWPDTTSDHEIRVVASKTQAT